MSRAWFLTWIPVAVRALQPTSVAMPISNSWRKLADPNYWYPENSLWGPVTYELALGSMIGDDELRVVYAGVTSCEQLHLNAYAKGTRPLSTRIYEELPRSGVLYYRSRAAATIEDAQRGLRELLAERDYAWNQPDL